METVRIEDRRYTQQEAQTAQTIVKEIVRRGCALTWADLSRIVEKTFGHVPSPFEDNGLIPALLNTPIEEHLRLSRSAAIRMLCGDRGAAVTA